MGLVCEKYMTLHVNLANLDCINTIIHFITRLLGCPQPQMYPPVALNQYTWVNRTQTFDIIYASRPHKHFEIDLTPKISSQQHVKYASNLMNIFI